MASGPVYAIVLAGPGAVKTWRNRLAGVRDGLHKTDVPAWENLVHGSDSDKAAEREIALFFGRPDVFRLTVEVEATGALDMRPTFDAAVRHARTMLLDGDETTFQDGNNDVHLRVALHHPKGG